MRGASNARGLCGAYMNLLAHPHLYHIKAEGPILLHVSPCSDVGQFLRWYAEHQIPECNVTEKRMTSYAFRQPSREQNVYKSST